MRKVRLETEDPTKAPLCLTNANKTTREKDFMMNVNKNSIFLFPYSVSRRVVNCMMRHSSSLISFFRHAKFQVEAHLRFRWPLTIVAVHRQTGPE